MTAEPKFSPATLEKIKTILAKYPPERSQSALIPVLWLAQAEFGGWLEKPALDLVAQTLNLPAIRVYEVASFYTMFNLKPVGKYHVQVCTNCSCMIRGSGAVLKALEEATNTHAHDHAGHGHISPDGLFTLTEVECLGACVAAPVMQVGSHYYTHLTPEKAKTIVTYLKAGKLPEPDTPPAATDPIDNTAYAEGRLR